VPVPVLVLVLVLVPVPVPVLVLVLPVLWQAAGSSGAAGGRRLAWPGQAWPGCTAALARTYVLEGGVVYEGALAVAHRAAHDAVQPAGGALLRGAEQPAQLLDRGLARRAGPLRAHGREGEVAAVLGGQQAHDLAPLAHGQRDGGPLLVAQQRQHAPAVGDVLGHGRDLGGGG
jgi:hypothetical protein